MDPDQAPQKAVSDLGLHCLPLVWRVFQHASAGNGMDWFGL